MLPVIDFNHKNAKYVSAHSNMKMGFLEVLQGENHIDKMVKHF